MRKRSGWKWSGWNPTDLRRKDPGAVVRQTVARRSPIWCRGIASRPCAALVLGLGALAPPATAAVGQGTPMTPERLTSLTQGRTMSLRSRAMPFSQITPGITQQMLYRIKLAPETPEVYLSVFCSNLRLSRFEAAITTLFGYRLVGRSQGEGMGLVFVPDTEAMAAAAGQRLQGRAAVEAGISRAVAWLRQPAALDTLTRTRCPAAGALRNDGVRRAFLLHAALPRAQRDRVMAGHPVTLPFAALPPASRTLVSAGQPAPKWVTFYLHHDPWSVGSEPRLAVRAEPSGKTWVSCPPLGLAPAHAPLPQEIAAELQMKLKGEPELEDLEPGEEAPAFLEWIADEGKISVMAEAMRPYRGDSKALKQFAATCAGLTLEEALDRVATFFGATWRCDEGWVLFQRRSTETLTRAPEPGTTPAVQVGRRE